MPKKSIGLLFTVTILATGLLVVLLAVLSYPEVVEAEITQVGIPGLSEKPGLDPRWLALITEEGARQSAQIMNGGPSINVDLTAQTVAGLSDSPLPVQITATRGVTILLDAIIQPTPIDQFYLYQVTVECEPWELDCFEFKADDIVWVEQGGLVVSMTLPLLTAVSDAVADQVDGRAPPNDAVTVYLFPSMESAAFLTATVAADGGGDYQVAWGPGYDVLPPDDGYSRYSAAVGKSAFVRYVTPLVRVENTGLEVAGIVMPDSEVEIEIRDAQGNLMFSTWTRANEFGTFFTLAEHYWGLYDQPSEFIRPGYQVHVEAGDQQISMTVAELSAQMDLSTQTVFGGGPPGATLGFVQMDGPLVNRNETLWHWNPSEFVTATVDSFGEFSVGTDLARGNYGAVIHRDAQGQQTFSRYTVPFMRARMGSAIPHWRFVDNLVDGQISGENQALTVTIQGPSGYLKDYFEVPAYFNGYFRHYQGEHQENITLDYGDVITVSTSDGPVLSMAMPNLTVEVDPNNYTVSGVAPAGAALKVFVIEEYIPDPPPYPPPFEAGNDYQPLEIELTASPDGNYLADFSSLGGFDPQSSGVVLMTFPDGNQVMRTFQVGAICPPRLRVGSSRRKQCLV